MPPRTNLPEMMLDRAMKTIDYLTPGTATEGAEYLAIFNEVMAIYREEIAQPEPSWSRFVRTLRAYEELARDRHWLPYGIDRGDEQ